MDFKIGPGVEVSALGLLRFSVSVLYTVFPDAKSLDQTLMVVRFRREDVFFLDGEEIDLRGPVEVSLLPER